MKGSFFDKIAYFVFFLSLHNQNNKLKASRVFIQCIYDISKGGKSGMENILSLLQLLYAIANDAKNFYVTKIANLE